MCIDRWIRAGAVRACLVVLMGGSPGQAFADQIYRWVDADGKLHFADQIPENMDTAQVVDAEGPPFQEHSAESQRRLEDNKRWFQQRSKERQAEEAARAKAQSKQARVDQKGQQRCDKAKQKLADTEAKYESQRRTWLKANAKRKLKDKLDFYRSEVERKCDF